MNGSDRLARFTVHLDWDFGERLKDAAVASRLSAAELCVLALTEYVLGLEANGNGGKPFPPRLTLGATHRVQ